MATIRKIRPELREMPLGMADVEMFNVPDLKEHSFEELEDFDIDGAGVTVGVEHFPLGPAGPFIRINTGAVEIVIRGHATDIDALTDAFIVLRKRLKKLNR